MANTKISAFSAASALTGTEELGGVQSAANAKITANQIKTFCNTQVFAGQPFPYPTPSPYYIAGGGTSAIGTLSTLNASGLKAAFMGFINFPGLATGATKTFSSSGGKIYYRAGTVTFANAGTTLDVGLQLLSTAAGPVARPDDSYLVKKSLVHY